MSGDEFPEDDFRSKMILGGVIGFILGAVIGALGLLHDEIWIWITMLGISFILLEVCQPRDFTESFIVIIAKGIFRVIGAILALSIFFGVALGIAYLIGLVFNFPTWHGYLERYSITRDYLWEGLTVYFFWVILEWIFRDRKQPFIENLISIFAISWMYGIVGIVVMGVVLWPFIILSIPLTFFDLPTLPTGPLGALVLGVLGGIYGALIGFVALFTHSVLPDYARWD